MLALTRRELELIIKGVEEIWDQYQFGDLFVTEEDDDPEYEALHASLMKKLTKAMESCGAE